MQRLFDFSVQSLVSFLLSQTDKQLVTLVVDIVVEQPALKPIRVCVVVCVCVCREPGIIIAKGVVVGNRAARADHENEN